jgi:hypothetical protein
MSTTPLCKHCWRLIRRDARAYAANGGFYHWECTEPSDAKLRLAVDALQKISDACNKPNNANPAYLVRTIGHAAEAALRGAKS